MSGLIDDQVKALSESVRTLSLIGASLKLRARQDVPRDIHEQVMLGSKAALGHDVGALSDEQAAALLGTIGMAFAEAGELFRNPDRGGEWKVEDTNLLQTQGQASRHVFRRILALAKTRPRLAETFRGRFLDVGTGVGGIALEAASTCPSLAVEGIDIWEPALTLAHGNVAASPDAERVNIRRCDVSELEPGRRYTLVWLPTMFMKKPVLEKALDRIAAASLSGAYLVAATYTRPSDDPVAASFVALRTLRSGGEPIEKGEVEEMLRSRSYLEIESDVAPLATFTLGRFP